MDKISRNAPTLDEIRAQRDAILALAARYHASNVRVFGSVARGDATPDSDVDLLMDLPPRLTLLKLSGLVRELQTLIGRRVEVADAANLREGYQYSILKDAQPL